MQITFDGEIDISVGKSRREKNWKQKKIKWSELVEKCSKTHRTAETHKEYINADPDRQSEIKDIGGFVGGIIVGGRRLKGSIAHRQLLTLDIDKPGPDFWLNYELLFNNAALIYSTHKHGNGPGEGRLRLLLPLAREVAPDEYEAIARKIAGEIDIDQFDPTTFEPSRLMYWPSTSSDGEYIFQYQDGKWLDPDEILGEYSDWKDTSQWPMASGLDSKINSEIKKAGDPLEKEGMVGVFCRVYNPIQDAIEKFLGDIYKPSPDMDNRYTYIHGSTANGLIIYDDKYAFSHHGTDPASGKLCNAFDLVRIHKFGSKDGTTNNSTPINKRPSHLAMLDFIIEIDEVKMKKTKEDIQAAGIEFGVPGGMTVGPGGKLSTEPGDPTIPVDPDLWMTRLKKDRQGNTLPTIQNIVLILNNDPRLAGVFLYNEFRNQMTLKHSVPWREVRDKYDAEFRDSDEAEIRLFLEKNYKIAHRANTTDAIEIVFRANSWHPVKQYLESLVWDGVKRADTIFIDYLGAANNKYTRTITRKMLLGALARIYTPGCKFDYVVTLIGEQGTGKSTIIQKLGKHWSSDSFNSFQNNRAQESIQGVWLMEIGEMAGLKKAEIEEVKHFISQQEDSYRPAYGRRKQTFPRSNIFIATTNETSPLVDKTGNRRYWPVKLHEMEPSRDIFQDFTGSVVDQIWAEVIQVYREEKDLFLSPEIARQAEKVQRIYTEEYPGGGLILAALDKLLPETWDKMGMYDRQNFYRVADSEDEEGMKIAGVAERTEICVSEIWYEILGKPRGSLTTYEAREIKAFLRNLDGWEEVTNLKDFIWYGRQRYFRKKFEL